MNLPVFGIRTKFLDGSELGIFYMEREAPQWDFRRHLENGIRRVQKKLPLPLLFEKLKGEEGGKNTGIASWFLSLLWERINDDVMVNRVCSPDLPDYWRFRVFLDSC